MAKENSFKRGFMLLKQKDAPLAKTEIMEGLGITTRNAWYQRLTGVITPRQSDRDFIEKVFMKYGIIDVWGDMNSNQLKDRKAHLSIEINELVMFAYSMLGNDGLDRVLSETKTLSDSIKSGKITIA